MSFVWVFMVAAGCLTAFATGRADVLTSAVLDGVWQAVELAVALAGVFCLWMGIEKLAEEAGLIDALSKALRPVLTMLFPHLRGPGSSLGTVTASVLSNVLGLSSSTPLGLKAMSLIREELGETHRGMESMATLVVINAAGFCLFPSTVTALRAAAGSRAPTLTAGPTAVAGLTATLSALVAYRLASRAFREGE